MPLLLDTIEFKCGYASIRCVRSYEDMAAGVFSSPLHLDVDEQPTSHCLTADDADAGCLTASAFRAPSHITVDERIESLCLTADQTTTAQCLFSDYIHDSEGSGLYLPHEFEVTEPDFAVNTVPQMSITLLNVSDAVRSWLELYVSVGGMMAIFRRFQDGVIVKSITFPVIDSKFSADQIVLTAEPVNINDLQLHRLQYTSTHFPGLL